MNERDYFGIFRRMVDIKDKAVLELGGCVPFELIAEAGVSKWVSTDINYKRLDDRGADQRPNWYELVICDAAKMPFRESSFDCVYSINTFEHVMDLESCIDNIFRILKPGGLFFSKFVPIWSSEKGHHTWVWHEGKAVTFDDNIIPGWHHLSHGERELKDVLDRKIDRDLSKKIIDYVFHSGDLNRLVDSDYERIFLKNPFKKIFFYRVKSRYRPEKGLISKIDKRYPGIKDHRTQGFFFLLSKGRVSLTLLICAFYGLF